MARVALALKFSEQAPLVLGSIRSARPATGRLLAVPRRPYQHFVCDDIDDVDNGLQDTLVPKLALVSIAHLLDAFRCQWKLRSAQRRGHKFRSLLARQRSRRRPSRIHAATLVSVERSTASIHGVPWSFGMEYSQHPWSPMEFHHAETIGPTSTSGPAGRTRVRARESALHPISTIGQFLRC